MTSRFPFSSVLMLAFLLLAPSVVSQPDMRAEAAPERPAVFRQFFPRCAQDGPSGMIEADYSHFGTNNQRAGSGWVSAEQANESAEADGWPLIHTYVRGLSGVNGSREWSFDALAWDVVRPGSTWSPVRGGTAWRITNAKPYYAAGPVPPDVVQVGPDVDADGVCDVATYGWNAWGSPPRWGGDGRLVMLSGANGTILWEKTIRWRASSGNCLYVGFGGYPTGMLFYDSPSGPKLAWKVTGGSYGCGSSFSDVISLMDARTGEERWNRTVGDSSDLWVFQYFSGVADLDGSGEPALILDVTFDPACTQRPLLNLNPDALPTPKEIRELLKKLLESQIKYPYAQALRGHDGSQLWGPTTFRARTQSGLGLMEESLPCFVTSMVKIVGDITGDAHPDVVGTYLIQEQSPQTALNARYRTYVAPISGANGSLVWEGHAIPAQGWGYVADINPRPNESRPYLAVGTIDVPPEGWGPNFQQQSQEDYLVAKGARYPPKEARLTVLKLTDGSALWGNTIQPLGSDTRLAYDFALGQFQEALAPRDYDGDGYKDLLLPAHYVPPPIDQQRLLSSAIHSYEVVSGRTGKVLTRFDAFGPHGRIVPCAGADASHVLVVSGTERRIDLTLRHAVSGAELWRHAIHTDFRPQAQLAGVNERFLGGSCAIVEDGRMFFGFDLGIYSDRRGEENRGIHGFLTADGTFEWFKPTLFETPANSATLVEFNLPPGGTPAWGKAVGPLAAIPAGALAGFLAMRGRSRRPTADAPADGGA